MQKVLDGGHPPEFSIYAENDLRKISPSWSSDERAEILLVESGNLELFIGNQQYAVKAGNAIVIAPNKLHKLAAADAGAFSYISLSIQSSMREFLRQRQVENILDFFAVSVRGPVLQLDDEQLRWLSALFHRLLDESRQKKGYYSSCVCSILELIFAEIARLYKNMPAHDAEIEYEQSDISRLIKNVIQYIDHNYREEITLSKIAREFWLNSSYLSRQFKNNVGMNITEFITARRIYYAKVMLLSSDKSISEIALEAGFNNIPYFNMVFKNSVGMPPKQFRKEHKHEFISAQMNFTEAGDGLKPSPDE